jgi:hypothetical protein
MFEYRLSHLTARESAGDVICPTRPILVHYRPALPSMFKAATDHIFLFQQLDRQIR